MSTRSKSSSSLALPPGKKYLNISQVHLSLSSASREGATDEDDDIESFGEDSVEATISLAPGMVLIV